jgi:hypothetical protein
VVDLGVPAVPVAVEVPAVAVAVEPSVPAVVVAVELLEELGEVLCTDLGENLGTVLGAEPWAKPRVCSSPATTKKWKISNV